MTDTKLSAHHTKPTTELFRDKDSAERAYRTIIEMGYTNSDFNLLLSDETRKRYFLSNDWKQNESRRTTHDGAGIEDVFNSIATTITAVGATWGMPGLCLVITGPLTGAIANKNASSINGGLVGALIGWGIPEEHARYYEQGLKDGGILIAIKPRNDEDAQYIQHMWNEILEDHIHT